MSSHNASHVHDVFILKKMEEEEEDDDDEIMDDGLRASVFELIAERSSDGSCVRDTGS